MKNKLFWTGMVGLLLAIVLIGCDEGTDEGIKVEAAQTTTPTDYIIVKFKVVAGGLNYALFAKQEGKYTLETPSANFRSGAVYDSTSGAEKIGVDDILDTDAYAARVYKSNLTVQKTDTKYLFGVLAYTDIDNVNLNEIVWSNVVTLK
jgi:hypothetical protein